jgi:uncharacterized protein YlaI
MKFFEWLAIKLQKLDYLPQHHLKDKRFHSKENGYYMCPRCGHTIDTSYAVEVISEEEVAKRREKVLKIKYTRKNK